MLQICYLAAPMGIKINWDALGISAAVACAIHCALLPLLMTSLPVFGANIIHNDWFEGGMIALSFLIGARALSHGRKKHHHHQLPLLLFTAGMLLLVLKQLFDHSLLLWFLIPAVMLVISAHWLNYRLCRKARHCHAEDCNH
jgi:phosphatidylserine synthase